MRTRIAGGSLFRGTTFFGSTKNPILLNRIKPIKEGPSGLAITCTLIELGILFWKPPLTSGRGESKGASTHKRPLLHRYGGWEEAAGVIFPDTRLQYSLLSFQHTPMLLPVFSF